MEPSPFIVDTLPPQIKKNWRWILGLGIVLVILGTIGLSALAMLTLASILLLGVFLFVAGIMGCVDLAKSKHRPGTALRTSMALLYLIAGAIVIYDPVLASSMITMILAWILIILGITRIALALSHKETHIWGWLFFAGLCSLILGLLILFQWPVSALWVIGLFIAVELIIQGWSYIFIAVSMRKKK